MKIADLQIHQEVIGEGEPIVMLHGWGANISLIRPLGERLAPLGYRVYLLDLPGFGQSEAPPIAWTVYDYARFVLAYLDAHGLAKTHLFGHSFGGRLSLILGADHADRIQKIVLANSAGIRTPLPWPTRARLTVYKRLRDGLRGVGLKPIADQLQAWYNGRYGSSDYQQISGVMRATFVQVVNEDLRPYAARVQRPTLLIWGDQDTDTPLWQGQYLEQTIPDAGLVVYQGAGHYSYLDRLVDATRVIDYFYRQA
ncbi:MAG: alpha/beta hydrolase [Anaerolineae bacterium]|jgi:pimeloyl-ACP methyl ester carboxylesterase|nr:alpha/beta hydrolase [Anaerolineae bacterium]